MPRAHFGACVDERVDVCLVDFHLVDQCTRGFRKGHKGPFSLLVEGRRGPGPPSLFVKGRRGPQVSMLVHVHVLEHITKLSDATASMS